MNVNTHSKVFRDKLVYSKEYQEWNRKLIDLLKEVKDYDMQGLEIDIEKEDEIFKLKDDLTDKSILLGMYYLELVLGENRMLHSIKEEKELNE